MKSNEVGIGNISFDSSELEELHHFDGYYGTNRLKVKIRKILSVEFNLNDLKQLQSLCHKNVQKDFRL